MTIRIRPSLKGCLLLVLLFGMIGANGKCDMAMQIWADLQQQIARMTTPEWPIVRLKMAFQQGIDDIPSVFAVDGFGDRLEQPVKLLMSGIINLDFVGDPS